MCTLECGCTSSCINERHTASHGRHGKLEKENFTKSLETLLVLATSSPEQLQTLKHLPI
jgi:hypothetical protein